MSTKLHMGLITVLHENLSLLPPTLRTSKAEIPEHVMLPALVSGSAHTGRLNCGNLFSRSFRGWKSKINEKCWQIWFL